MSSITVSIHLKKPHYQDYDILTQDQTIESGMAQLSNKTADKIIIKQEGSLVLYVDGTWAYHSDNRIVHPENFQHE